MVRMVPSLGQRNVMTATCWMVMAALRSATWRWVSTAKVSQFQCLVKNGSHF